MSSVSGRVSADASACASALAGMSRGRMPRLPYRVRDRLRLIRERKASRFAEGLSGTIVIIIHVFIRGVC